jgi:glycosyltransferase involved in cell wall biosynthesis
VPGERISVLPNGVDTEWMGTAPAPAEIDALRAELGLGERFVASYSGTVGRAHGVDVIGEAARRCEDPDVIFLVLGAGAEWGALRASAGAPDLDNFRLIEKQPRARIRLFYALSDLSIVHLRDRPAFRKVIPSKMFESMAMRRPIVLGVPGHAAEILQQAGAGVSIAPEDPDALLAAVLSLKNDPPLRKRLGDAGAAYVRENNDRLTIARRYWEILQRVASGS